LSDLTGDDIPADALDAEIELRLGAVPRPVDWHRVSAVAAPAEWAALDAWVRWLGARYDLDGRELPPCWHRHGSLVDELSGLHGAHQVAYDPTQAASAAADWHRVLWDTRIRLREWVSRAGCTDRGHNPPVTAGWFTEPDQNYREGFAQTVRDDVHYRETPD